jgi:hypothetical protein
MPSAVKCISLRGLTCREQVGNQIRPARAPGRQSCPIRRVKLRCDAGHPGLKRRKTNRTRSRSRRPKRHQGKRPAERRFAFRVAPFGYCRRFFGSLSHLIRLSQKAAGGMRGRRRRACRRPTRRKRDLRAVRGRRWSSASWNVEHDAKTRSLAQCVPLPSA